MPKQQHYAFYFIHLISRTLTELPNYYLKLSPPFFKDLKEQFSSIISHVDVLADSNKGEVSLSTVYQILKISERIVEKSGKSQAKNMKILIESLGTLKKLRDEQVLKKIIKHLTNKNRRRESKGVIGFTKGLFSSLAGKKEETVAS